MCSRISTELLFEGVPLQLSSEIADRTLIARLEMDPQSMSYVHWQLRVSPTLKFL